MEFKERMAEANKKIDANGGIENVPLKDMFAAMLLGIRGGVFSSSGDQGVENIAQITLRTLYTASGDSKEKFENIAAPLLFLASIHQELGVDINKVFKQMDKIDTNKDYAQMVHENLIKQKDQFLKNTYGVDRNEKE